MRIIRSALVIAAIATLFQRADLILAHKPAVTDNVGSTNSCKSPLAAIIHKIGVCGTLGWDGLMSEARVEREMGLRGQVAWQQI